MHATGEPVQPSRRKRRKAVVYPTLWDALVPPKTVIEVPYEIAERIARTKEVRRWVSNPNQPMPFEYIAVVVYAKHGVMLSRQGIQKIYNRGLAKVARVVKENE
jgi:hypothetical protein